MVCSLTEVQKENYYTQDYIQGQSPSLTFTILNTFVTCYVQQRVRHAVF